MYILVNKVGSKLSGFYPNSDKPELSYRKGDWYTYPTRNEAESHLSYIKGHGVGKTLRIIES